MNKWRNNSRYILLALTMILAVTLIAIPVFAGVGNSVSHSSSGGYHSSGDGGGGIIIGYLLGSLFRHPIIALILIIVIFLIYKKYSADMTGTEDWNPLEDDNEPAYQPGPLDLSALKASDPDFSEDSFTAWVNNMFLQLQEAWQEKDWKKVRPFESDELFNTHNKQLEEFIENGTTNVIDEVAILRTAIRAYRESGDKEVLEVYLKCRLKDYIIEDESEDVIEGDPDDEITMEYLMTLARKKGVKTKVTEHTSVTRCPNCGASISINASGECEYCNSVVSNGEFDWVLTKYEVLSQN